MPGKHLRQIRLVGLFEPCIEGSDLSERVKKGVCIVGAYVGHVGYGPT